MFLTSIIATFLTAISFSSSSSFNATSGVDQYSGLPYVNAVTTLNYLSSHDFNVFYSYTDENDNSATVNIFKAHMNGTTLEYGYNGIDNNIICSPTFNFTVNNTVETYNGHTILESTGSSTRYLFDLSSYSVTPSTPFNIRLTFTLLDEVTYSTISASNLSSSFDEGYDEGYDVGYDFGYSTGKQEGYAQGFDYAKDLYENSDAQINSIFGGILDIGMLPLQFFLSVFNFEIFGINLSGFVSALLSVAIVIIITRIILGSKEGS